MTLDTLPLRDILLVILGGLFGWTLGKMKDTIVYAIIAVAIVLLIVVLKDTLT